MEIGKQETILKQEEASESALAEQSNFGEKLVFLGLPFLFPFLFSGTGSPPIKSNLIRQLEQVTLYKFIN